jgi:hypothetical protein
MPRGHVFVENSGLVQKLQLDENDSGGPETHDAASSSSASGFGLDAPKSTSRSRQSGTIHAKFNASLTTDGGIGSGGGREDRGRELLQRALAQRRERDEKRLGILSNKLRESLSFLDDVDKDLALVDETKRTKTRRQFEDWNQNVHGKIVGKIAKEVNSMDKKALHEKKNEYYNKFLEITNRKPAIFRDIIIEAEYDPQEVNRASIRAKTSRLKDPLNIDFQKMESENAMLPPKPGGEAGKKKELCRDSLPAPLWASGKIEATPFGMFSSLMDDAHKPNELSAKRTNSTVAFDDFSFPKGKEAVDIEMPKGKRPAAARHHQS